MNMPVLAYVSMRCACIFLDYSHILSIDSSGYAAEHVVKQSNPLSTWSKGSLLSQGQGHGLAR